MKTIFKQARKLILNIFLFLLSIVIIHFILNFFFEVFIFENDVLRKKMLLFIYIFSFLIIVAIVLGVFLNRQKTFQIVLKNINSASNIVMFLLSVMFTLLSIMNFLMIAITSPCLLEEFTAILYFICFVFVMLFTAIIFLIRKKIYLAFFISMLFFFSHFLIWAKFSKCINCFYKTDTCLDTNRCEKGVILNTEYGLLEINEENCIKLKGVWINNKVCEFNKK